MDIDSIVNNVFPPTPFYNSLMEMVLEARANSDYDYVQIKEDPVNWVNKYQPLYAHLIIGTHSVTDLTNKVKYIQEYPVGVGEMVYQYLKTICDKVPRRQFVNSFAPPPAYFGGGAKGFLSYVDIRACYFSIYSVSTLDLIYTGSVYNEGDLEFPFIDDIAMHKGFRNSLFGIARKMGRKRYYNGMWQASSKEIGPYFAPGLIGYTMDTIQAIAQDACKRFNVYAWLTDAAILPASQANSFREYLREEWLMDSREDARGNGRVTGWNSYRIGEKVGGASELTMLIKQSNNNFVPVDVEFLKEIRRSNKGEM